MKRFAQKWLLPGLGILCFTYVYARSAHNLGWPLRISLGVCFGLLVFLITRRNAKPSPFQLVLRLANDDTGDSDDGKLFDKLHVRFKSLNGKGDFKFDGFDIGGGYVWFYFKGTDGKAIRDAVLSSVVDCTFREGSYFEISGQDKILVPAV